MYELRTMFLRQKHVVNSLMKLAPGEVGGMSPLQLSSRTQFAKIEDKKVIAEIISKNLTAGFFKTFNANKISV